jgi:hypothetical protein
MEQLAEAHFLTLNEINSQQIHSELLGDAVLALRESACALADALVDSAEQQCDRRAPKPFAR